MGAVLLLALVLPSCSRVFVSVFPTNEVSGIAAGAAAPGDPRLREQLAPKDKADLGYAMIFPGRPSSKFIRGMSGGCVTRRGQSPARIPSAIPCGCVLRGNNSHA